jgi:hypothetical protein
MWDTPTLACWWCSTPIVDNFLAGVVQRNPRPRWGELWLERVAVLLLIVSKGAASILGVSEMTLRRWDKTGKFKARRHPINNYRFYRRDEVTKLRKMIEAGKAA